jgi:hypothetical protein
MAARLGKNASVKLGTDLVGRLNSMSITVNNGTVDIVAFGDDWKKMTGTVKSWTGSFSGSFDLSDTQQNELHTLALSGNGETSDIRFYEDTTNYWTPDTVTDSESVGIISSYSWNADQSGVVTFSMTVDGSGPIKRAS